MKIKTNQKELVVAGKQIGRVLPKKSLNPVLNNVLLELKQGKMFLWTTDISTGLRIEVDTDGQEELETMVSGKSLVETISLFGGDLTEIEFKDEKIVFKNNNDRVVLPALPARDWPKFKTVFETESSLSWEQKEGVEIEKKVGFAASTDLTRPQLMGILIKPTEEKLNLVGTDGFRLSLWDKKSDLNSLAQTILMPMKAIRDINSLLDSYQEKKVNCGLDEEGVRFWWQGEKFVYLTNLIGMDFPPYEKIVPLAFEKELLINKEDLLLALGKAQVFAREAANVVKISFKEREMKLTVKSINGQYESNLALESDALTEVQIAFNIKYLVDFLNVIKSENVWLGMNESTKPVMLAEEKGGDFRCVVMPFKATD